MRRLVIIGAGGHGREALDTVEAVNAIDPTWLIIGVVADQARAGLLDAHGVSLLGPPSVVADLDAAYVLAIGMPVPRRVVAATLDPASATTVVHPRASIGSNVEVGAGLLAFAGAVVTTDVRIGRHVHLNVGAVVSHDSVLGDYVTLSPRATLNGNVMVGDGAFIGTGAIVLPGRRIGVGAVVGAGAVVVDDVADGVTVKGVPAR